MRTLHPLGIQERFIAQGMYRRRLNGAELPYSEAWTTHELADGGVLTRIDQDARASEAWSRLVEVLRSKDGAWQRVTAQILMHAPDMPYKRLRLDYTFYDNYVQVSRELNANEREYAELDLPAGARFILPDYRVFWGDVITQDAQAPLLTLALRADGPPGSLDAVEAPQIRTQQAEDLALGSRIWQTQRVELATGAVCWLDSYGVVLRYRSEDPLIEDTLVNYARRN